MPKPRLPSLPFRRGDTAPLLDFSAQPSRAPEPSSAAPPDQAAREAALDVKSSWIVQAPAGAGKTELLTQRFLALLAIVDEPEEVLAITFTRAATAEMRGRILTALEAASHAARTDGEPTTLALARDALARSIDRGWQLLEQPHRLDVQTIDSLCMRLAHGQPLLSRLGGRLEPTEQASAFYELAAQSTFAQLGRAPSELEAALRHLLLLRDNNLDDCRRLIAGLLEQREQWRHVFVLGGTADLAWDQVRARLEAPLSEEVRRVLEELHAASNAEPALVTELLALAQYACHNGSQAKVQLLQGIDALPAAHPGFLDHWGCLRNFLLTEKGAWRKTVTKRDGFPGDGDGLTKAERTGYKQRMKGLIQTLQRDERSGRRLRELLCAVPMLPASTYDEDQWQTLLSVFRVLRHAVAELHVIFAERNQVDFAELSIAAATILDDQETTRGLLASEARRHLLIDEFQDTSRRQHQLIGRLLREWQPGDGRTCFLVGDPMQSIYVFRQAEVELFGRVQRRGLDCGTHTHPCAGLRLSENFRSHAGLVNPLNQHFAAIFGEAGQSDEHGSGDKTGHVPFAPSTATTPAIDDRDAVEVHAFFSNPREPESAPAARCSQVDRVVELVAQELPRIRAAQLADKPGKSYTVAILGRAKNHLTSIATALRARGILFRAVELESLADRQEIIDLRSLVRALLHPMDRIAWLSVLRAPWCGLSLGDLHTLTGADEPGFRFRAVADLIEQRTQLLTEAGSERLHRVSQVLGRAAAERFRGAHAQSLAAWVERAWTSLGGPAYLSTEESENAETFFRLLDGLPPDGIDVLNGSLDAALKRLCASPDTGADEHFGVQLMTIHKAKGLGFEVVIVPGLERLPGGDGAPLVTMLERVRPAQSTGEASSLDEDEILVAPLGRRGEQHRTYKWVQARRRERQTGERKRLFYVACTRARLRLHLLGTAELTADAIPKPGAPESLLACAWPALGPIFARQWEAARARLPEPVLAPMRKHVEAPSENVTPEPGLVERLAAADASPGDALRLMRVPRGFAPSLALRNVTVTSTFPPIGAQASSDQAAFDRPKGSFEQRARGNAVHAMLESISERWALAGRAGNLTELVPQLDRLTRTVLARAGLGPARIDALSASLVEIALAAADSSEGRWILAPHQEARSEWSLSGWSSKNSAGARLRTLRVDRVFLGGDAPLSEGRSHLWVIDYKTGGSPATLTPDAYLEAQKEQWQPQLEAYGSALRSLHQDTRKLRYGLYFPELLRLKAWAAE